MGPPTVDRFFFTSVNLIKTPPHRDLPTSQSHVEKNSLSPSPQVINTVRACVCGCTWTCVPLCVGGAVSPNLSLCLPWLLSWRENLQKSLLWGLKGQCRLTKYRARWKPLWVQPPCPSALPQGDVNNRTSLFLFRPPKRARETPPLPNKSSHLHTEAMS